MPRRRPSQADRTRFTTLLRTLTPGPDAYLQYRARVNLMLRMHRLVPQTVRAPTGRPATIRRLALRTSELFSREYLLGYVDTDWFKALAPHTDAITWPSDAQSSKPHLILLPQMLAAARSRAVRSVVEHECVHVNQAILGLFPGAEEPACADDLWRQLFMLARVEYQAHVLQLTRYPELYLTHGSNLPFDHWCVLSGYAQALETTLRTAVDRGLRREVVEAFLNGLGKRLPRAFRDAGFDGRLAPWFQKALGHHVTQALLILKEQDPAIGANETFGAAVRWVKSR